VRDELARLCTDSGAAHDEEFGQHEKLAHRIQQLLHDYNGPADVLLEHWQNCDDAGATEILFALDTTQYAAQSLVNDRAAMLQGPALILASSKPLTKSDIHHMQRMGFSHKRGEFAQTGQFGVGLNCMYHLADAWLLLANDTLHLFDPLQRVVEGNAVGSKWSRQKLESHFADMLKPFAALDRSRWPTVFRLPLRQAESEFGPASSPNEIEKLLTGFGTSAQQSLVFSRCIRTVVLAMHHTLLHTPPLWQPRRGLSRVIC
jgi:sacsin